VRFLDIRLASPHPDRAAAFYRDTFGVTSLHFERATPPAPYHIAFAIPPGSIQGAHAWARPRLAMLSDELFDFSNWNADALYFEDPDGNVLELIARKGPERAFAVSDLIGVCELGLPVRHPPTAVAMLEDELGLDVFDGDRDLFTAVGDPDGLFIVVRPGRNWLPTELAAAECPATVMVETPRRGKVRLGPVTIVSRTPR